MGMKGLFMRMVDKTAAVEIALMRITVFACQTVGLLAHGSG